MESSKENKPQLGDQGEVWKTLLIACLQAFNPVHWDTILSQWNASGTFFKSYFTKPHSTSKVKKFWTK